MPVTDADVEQCWPVWLSIVGALILAALGFEGLRKPEVTAGFIINVASIAFGFLISALALLVSLPSSPGMSAIKQAGRYPDLIRFNKVAVIAAAIVAIIFSGIMEINELVECLPSWGKRILWSGLSFSIFWFLTSTYRFLKIFYVLASKP